MNPEELLSLGRQLHAVRVEKELSLDKVAAETRIRTYILEGIENGEVDPSFTEMQIRGFIRNYATYLQLDLDAMRVAYQKAVQEHTKTRNPFSRQDTSQIEVPIIPIRGNTTTDTPPQPIKRVTKTVPIQTVITDDTNNGIPWSFVAVLGVIGVLLLGGIIFAVTQVVFTGGDSETTAVPLAIQSEGNAPTPLATFDTQDADPMLTGSQTPSMTPSPADSIENQTDPAANDQEGVMPAPPTTEAEASIDMTGADRINIVISATQRSWVSVTVDGTVQYEGLLRPDTQLDYTGLQSVIFRTANAAGVVVIVNNQALGVLGERGAAYENTFNLDNVPAILASPTLSQEVPTIDPAAPEPLLPSSDSNLPTLIPTPELLVTDIPLDESPAQLTATALYQDFEPDFTPTPTP